MAFTLDIEDVNGRRPKFAKHEEAESKPLQNHQANDQANGADTTNVALDIFDVKDGALVH